MSAHSDDSESYLGDSAYEILTDSTLLTDDEDDAASSVASLDAHSEGNPDNISDEGSELADAESPPSGIPSFGGLDSSADEEVDDEGDTTLREEEEDQASTPETIAFDEPESFDGDRVNVVRTVTAFDEKETAQLCQLLKANDIHEPKFYATIRQTMARQLLTVDEPFRVMYVGSSTAKDAITQKLAEALSVPVCDSLSSTGSWEGVNTSRYNIVPVAFGDRSASPQVELIDNSLGVGMTLSVCTAAKQVRRDDGSDIISLWLNGNQSVSSVAGKNGVHLDSPGWKLPHLTVIYCSDDDNSHRRQIRTQARSFMTRHSIPTLIISQTPLYFKTNEAFAVDTRSPHMCIESNSPQAQGFIHRRMPVDLASLLSMDVRQMNRNLACITGLASDYHKISPAPGDTPQKTRGDSSVQDSEKDEQYQWGSESLWPRRNKREGLWKFFLAGWLLVFGIVGATMGVAWFKLSQASTSTPATVLKPIFEPAAIVEKTSTTTGSTSALSITSSVISRVTVTGIESCHRGGSFAKPDFGGFLGNSAKLAVNDSSKFQIQVLENNKLLLRPPQSYLLLKKQPALFATVSRDGKTLEAELSSSDGVYTLTIQEAEAWGIVIIDIWTRDKPRVKETLEVDLGNQWLKVASWKKVAADRKSELQKFLEDKSADVKEMGGRLAGMAGTQAAEAKDAVVSKMKGWADTGRGKLAKVYGESKMLSFPRQLGAWPRIAYAEKKEVYVKKAQSQAKSLWQEKKETIARRLGRARGTKR